MAGLTGRMSTVVKAKVSKVLDRAEDPAETLDYSYPKQLEQLQNVKKGIADVVTAKKRLQMQESSLQQSVVKLDTQARQALAAGQEDLARTALERKNVAQTELQSLDTQVTELEEPAAEADRLRADNCAPRSRPSAPRRRSSRRSTRPPRRRCGSPRRRPASASRWPTSGWRCSARVDKTENMKARADAVSELEAAGHLRRPHPARLGRGRHRPPAQAALEPARGRRRAREDEGRAGQGTAPAGAGAQISAGEQPSRPSESGQA